MFPYLAIDHLQNVRCTENQTNTQSVGLELQSSFYRKSTRYALAPMSLIICSFTELRDGPQVCSFGHLIAMARAGVDRTNRTTMSFGRMTRSGRCMPNAALHHTDVTSVFRRCIEHLSPLQKEDNILRSFVIMEEEKYRYENGRRYHNVEAGSYYLPNDESEVSRLGKLPRLYISNGS